MDWDNRRHGGVPRHPEDARGLKVVITDTNGDTHQFWNYTLVPFQSDAEWWVYIVAIATSHGIDLDDATYESGDDEG